MEAYMSKFVLEDLEGMHKLGCLVLENTVGLMFRFDTKEQAEAFATTLEESIEEGYLDFELQLGSRNRVQ
jgi:hypothetical protein